VVDGELRLDGAEGDPFDGLRALCAAAWAALDRDGEPVDGRKALAELGF
jgi:hypothetical protein